MGLLDRIPFMSRMRGTTLPAVREGSAGSNPAGLAPSQLPVDRQLEYIMGDGTDRSLALTVAALHRCVTLIAASVAEVVANSAHVVDFDSRKIDRQPVNLLHLLRSSPDGDIASYTFIEDLMLDLMLEGNALAVIDRESGRPFKLRRMIVRTATVHRVKGRVMYCGEIAGQNSRSEVEYIDARNIIHARWADMTGRDTAPTRGGRSGFATSPLVALSSHLQVSREMLRWLTKFYDTQGGTLKSDHAIIFPDGLSEPEQKVAVQGIAQYALSRRPLVLFHGAKVENLKTLPQDAETSTLRDQEVESIGRVYGIPPPLMGLNTTQWGSGISELARLFWKFAGRPAMHRLLQPMSFRLLPKGHDFAVNELEILRGDTVALTALINATKGQTDEPILSRRENRSMLGVNWDFPEDEEPASPPAPEPDAPPPDPDAEPDSDTADSTGLDAGGRRG